MELEYCVSNNHDGYNCLKQIIIKSVEKEDIKDGCIIVKIPFIINETPIRIIGVNNSKALLKTLSTIKKIKSFIKTIKFEIEDGPIIINNLIAGFPVDVTIPSSVEEIGPSSFKDMFDLKVRFKENSSLRKIGYAAFSNVVFTEEFCLPEKCTSIKEKAFLSAIFKEGFCFNNSLTEISSQVFFEAGFKKGTNLFIPDSVEKIKTSAFSKAYNIESIHFTENSNISLIEEQAFYISYSIKHIEIKNKKQELILKDKCFSNMQMLKSVDMIDSQITKIPQECFFSCPVLTDITLPKILNVIEASAFLDCALDKIYLPKNLGAIDERAFKNCNLKEITKDSNCKLIFLGNEVFSNNQLTTIPPDLIENVKICGNGIFSYNAFEKITLYPLANMNAFGNQLFVDNKLLTSVNLKNNINKWDRVPSQMFTGCVKLKECNMPKTVKILEQSCFAECGFSEIELNSIEVINPFAFFNCVELKRVNLKKAPIKKIKQGAFRGAVKLEKISLPSYYTEINSSVFDVSHFYIIEKLLADSPFVKII